MAKASVRWGNYLHTQIYKYITMCMHTYITGLRANLDYNRLINLVTRTRSDLIKSEF